MKSRNEDPSAAVKVVRIYQKNKLFRRIEADIKERNRKKKVDKYEEYTDRHRCISVAMGSKDIRSTISGQKLSSKGNLNPFFDEEQSDLRTLLTQAEHELNRGTHRTALSYLNRAIEMYPMNPECILMRSHCLVQNSEYDEALAEVEDVLQFDRYRGRGLTIKGDALYHLGDFEHALVFYHRASKYYTSASEKNRQGIQRSEEAIVNALMNERASKNFSAISFISERIPATIFGVPWSSLKIASNNLLENSVDSRRKKKLLGKLGRDLEYLEDLLESVNLVKRNSRSIQNETQSAISFLKNRQDFWNQVKPMVDKKSGKYESKLSLKF